MQKKKSFLSYVDLPETITPYDYANWRGIGEKKKINKKCYKKWQEKLYRKD